MIDLYGAIGELSAHIRARTLSSVAVVDACLARIEALNPRLNAFITVTPDAARAAATVAESEINAGRWRGPLHGVPVAVKDFYDTAGIKTTAAFERFANRVPTKDADVIKRLKDAGAIVIGKTNMDTLGMATTGLMSFYGPVKNPWNSDYIPGGSSSGSAVAVASGMCYATVDDEPERRLGEIHSDHVGRLIRVRLLVRSGTPLPRRRRLRWLARCARRPVRDARW